MRRGRLEVLKLNELRQGQTRGAQSNEFPAARTEGGNFVNQRSWDYSMQRGGSQMGTGDPVTPTTDGSLNYEPHRVGYYLGIWNLAPSAQNPKSQLLGHLPTGDYGEDRR